MASLPSPTQVAKDHYGIYESWYKYLDPKNSGCIQAGTAAQFLKKSGIKDHVLSRIWDLSDPGAKGHLDKSGLFVALKLVALVQNGEEPNIANITNITPLPKMGEPPPHPPPPHPAPPVAKSPGPPVVPAPPVPTMTNSTNSGVWTITPHDRQRYDQIFNSLGPEANKIPGNKVRGVMMNSQLPTDVLGKIWDLADMDKDGSLDRVEFSIAMHLIYKVLEHNPLPATLPQDMLSSARRAGVAGQGPVPAPLAPPSLVQATPADNNKLKDAGPPPAPWVVTAADKARYDVMFHNADIDKDGFVSGQEIKGIFLQSGLPQMVLAHIWNICDMKQTGKLTSEQFALAMWLIQQKIAGIDPPSVLTPEMIPPTMRPKPTEAQPVIAKPTYSNPELQAVADEIDELGKDRLKLESEIQQKEASIRLKNNDNKNFQTELDTLTATLKQLENQKGAALKRLDDLGAQKFHQESVLRDLDEQIRLESLEVEALRTQVEEQEETLKEQEDEVMSKQKELDDLRAHEMELEASVMTTKKKIEQFSKTQQETQLFLSQAKVKIEEMQEQERHMTEVLTGFDSAISSGDASSIPESFLIEVNPTFNDHEYLKVGPPTPKTPLSPVESPANEVPETNGLPEPADAAIPKGKDTSFIDGHDPFAQAFGGGGRAADPFSSWDNPGKPAHPPPPTHDPFGSESFAHKAQADAFGTEPFADAKAESPTPALPPKKAKQPPPRPAPPKARPAKPPPPQINSNNNPTNPKAAGDPFAGAWSNPKSESGFADFANFANFDNKYSSAMFHSGRSGPWGDKNGSKKLDPFGGTDSNKIKDFQKLDPFQDTFVSKNANSTAYSSPWPPINSPSSGFGSQNGSTDNHIGGFGSDDPFGGDYDPFKDTTTLKEADEFSWDDEPDSSNFTDSVSDGSLAPPPFQGGKNDPFYLSSDDSPENRRTNYTKNKTELNNATNQSQRSKSALSDPFSKALQINQNVPSRSQTSLGQPRIVKEDFDFDPLSKNSTSEFPAWKSNEDILNENTSLQIQKNSANQIWGGDSVKPFNNITPSNNVADPSFSYTNNNLWAQSSNISANYNTRLGQEEADLKYAMALSRTLNQPSAVRNTRSPSTGL